MINKNFKNFEDITLDFGNIRNYNFKENVIKNNGNINNTTFKDLRNIDYSLGESYQFRDIRKGEKYLEIVLDNNEKIEARLFGDISKDAVSELEKTEKAGILKNFKMSLGDLGELIPIFNQRNNNTFSSGHTDEINFNLLPYKGAIVVESYTNEKGEEIGGYFKIIASTSTDSNNLYIKNKGINKIGVDYNEFKTRRSFRFI